MNTDMEKLIASMIPCPYSILLDNGDMTILYANDLFYRLIERREDDIIRKYNNKLSGLVNSDDLRSLKDIIKNSKNISGLLRFRKPDGSLLQTETFISKLDDNRLFCLFYDITLYNDYIDKYEEMEHICRFVMTKSKSYMFEYYPSRKAIECHSYGSFSLNGGGTIDNFPESMIEAGLIHEDSVESIRQAVSNIIIGTPESVCEVQMKDGYGNFKWYQFTVEKVQFNNSTHIMGLLKDISSRKEATIAYLRETQYYRAVLSDSDAWGDIDVTDNKINRVGGIWGAYKNLVSSMTYDDLVKSFIKKVVHPSDRDHYIAVMDKNNFIESYKNGINKLGCDFRRIVTQNKMIWMRITIHLFTDPINNHITAALYLANIDNEKKKELLLQRESKRDSLTDALNKRMTETSIKAHMGNPANKSAYAFMLLDIDNFKDVNDNLGHALGDKALIKVANILKSTLGKEDIVGRFGGDEFIIFIKNIATKEALEERLAEINFRLQSADNGLPVTCSVGIVFGSDYSTTYDELFHQADIALYSAKGAGKNQYIFYDKEINYNNITNLPYVKYENNNQAHIMADNNHSAISSIDNFDSFLSELGEIAYLVDPSSFELILGNKAFYDRIGLVKEECLGMKCYELLQNRTSPCPFCSKVNWTNDKFYIWKNHNPVLEQDFLIKNKLVKWQNKEMMLAISVDISNNKNIADFMDDSTNIESALLGCVYKMTEAETLEKTMAIAIEAICHFYKAGKVQLWERVQTSDNFALICEHQGKTTTEALPVYYERTISEWLETLPATTLLFGSPEEMFSKSFEMYQLMNHLDISNYYLVPLSNRQEILGFITIENIEIHYKNTSFIEPLQLFMVKDIQKFRRENTIEHMRSYDSLTGLPNRISYETYSASFNGENVKSIGILAANINGLNKTNNTSGYEKGNESIKECAVILTKIFTECRIYRHSGDEFIITAEDLPRESFEAKAHKFKTFLEQSDKLSVAFGYVWDDSDKDFGLLVRHAYELMKINKRMHYNSGKSSPYHAKYEILSDLLANLESGDFIVYLQPKKNLSKNIISGAEALIRHRENDGSITPPVKFLGNLEARGIIRYVDLFVFEEVCKLLERWEKEGKTDIKISVNFSRLTLLESDIVANVEFIINKYAINRSNIEIEITESVSDMGKSILCRIASDFKKANFSISLDDFGTKYTNLSILADISFDLLKLDKSLINTLTGKKENKIIIKNIISMCRELGTETIAEGVETADQEAILKSLGCNLVQGYLYGRPMAISEFEKLIQI